jgi:N-acyl-D-aspartate/D-glutamate deacylase
MAYDLLIKNGTIVDGTGGPRFNADVAIHNGRIAALGNVDGAASAVIDAGGKIVCPGFVDPHTHYDAQITWDPLLSSSAEHGVTTVVMGNCGVGIAPCRPADREWLADDLVTVEGIDKEVLVEGIKWEWETFPEYIDAAERRGSALNLAFLTPITPLRTYVLGAEANERAATPAETQTIAAMLREAMEAGAWGFTTTASRQHIGHGGKPLAARLASRDELAAYAKVLKGCERGVIELALTKRYATLADDEEELLEFLLDASNRPITWLSLNNLIEKPGATIAILDRVESLIRRGAIPQILTRPLLFDFNLRRPFMFTEMNAAKPLFDATFEKQMAIYADAGFREAFKDELKQSRKWAPLAKNVIVVSAENPELKKYEGSTVGEIAQERNQDPNDVFFDLAVADNLQIKFVVPRANTDPLGLAQVLSDSRTMIGLSDAGAHLDMLCESG